MNKTLLPTGIATICLCALLSSCAKNITCTDGVIATSAIGFTTTDFDSAYVVRYKQDNAFDSIADSTHVTYYSYSSHDTGSLRVISRVVTNGSNTSFLIPGYDYKIFLPAAGRTYAITKIVQQGNKTQSYSDGPFDKRMVSCINNIISCNLNGSPVSALDNIQGMQLNIVK